MTLTTAWAAAPRSWLSAPRSLLPYSFGSSMSSIRTIASL